MALTDQPRRFVPGFPARGSSLLLNPNTEIARLATIAAGTDDLVYLDQRVASVDAVGEFELVLVWVGFNSEDAAARLAGALAAKQPVVFFGPAVAAFGDAAPEFLRPRVLGDITAIWATVRADVLHGSLKDVYRAPTQPTYTPASYTICSSPDMNGGYRSVQFARGCSCPEPYRTLCPERLYFGAGEMLRPPDEVLGEVIALPGKHLHLLDDDVARYPDYYFDLFRRLWNYPRHWTLRSSDRIFAHPELTRLLAKAGTKTLLLDESFVSMRMDQAIGDDALIRELYRRVKTLHSRRMLVGTRLTLEADLAPPMYDRIASVLRRIDIDFVETRFTRRSDDGRPRFVPPDYRPMLGPGDPAWVRAKFYSMGAIADRLVRRPRRVGFYSTLVHLLPRSMAHRQNYFEGIPDH